MRPGPKIKTGTKKKIDKNAAVIKSSKFVQVANKQPAIAEGVRMAVENLCNPTCASLLPCGTGARVFPTYYHREETLQPSDTSSPFNGVVTLRPHRGSFLSIDTDNGALKNLTAANIPGTDLYTFPTEYKQGVRYSPKFQVSQGSTNYGVSVLVPVGSSDYVGQDDTGKWIPGFVNVLEGNLGDSVNATFSNLVFQTASETTHVACSITLGEIDLSDGTFPRFTTVSVATPTVVTGNLDTISGTGTGKFSYFIEGTSSDSEFQAFLMKCAFGSIDISNLDGNVVVYPPTSEDAIYDTLVESSSKYRLDAMSLLLQFRGADMSNAGSVAIALVPEGTNLPLNDPAACYEAIAKLPYDKYTGPLKLGAHCFWRPATIRELLFADNRVHDPRSVSNFIVVAWRSPATTAGQPPEVIIKVDSVWEWIYDSQSLPQFRAPFGWSYLEALYASISMYNPAGENPGHMKKIKDIAKKVASNPVVKKLATDAVNLGMQEAKKLLPAIMGSMVI